MSTTKTFKKVEVSPPYIYITLMRRVGSDDRGVEAKFQLKITEEGLIVDALTDGDCGIEALGSHMAEFGEEKQFHELEFENLVSVHSHFEES